MTAIHPTALVSQKAILGENVSVGPFSVIHDNVEIGSGTVIGGHCEIGCPTPLANGSKLRFGANSLIRSHSIFYEGSTFGDRLVTGHRVTVRELTVAGENLQIGTLSDIQGHCTIGNFVRFHSNVHIGQKSTIGNFVWIFPYVVLTNDPHPPSETLIGCKIDDFAVIATMSVVLPGVRVASHTLVGAHSLVNRNVREGVVVSGNPAKEVCSVRSIKLKDGTDRSAYPWPTHFTRGYPEQLIAAWASQSFEHLNES